MMGRREFLQWIGLAPVALAAPLMLPDNIPAGRPKWMVIDQRAGDLMTKAQRGETIRPYKLTDPLPNFGVGPINTSPSDF